MSAAAIVHALLAADSALRTLVSDRIYAGIAKQTAPLPYVVFQEVDAVPQGKVEQASNPVLDARVQVTAVSDDYAVVKAVRQAATRACNFSHGVLAGEQVLSVVRESIGSDDFEPQNQWYYQSFDLLITYVEGSNP